MSKRTLRTLAAIVVGLVAILYFLETDDRQDMVTDGNLLLPDLKARINEVTAVVVTRAGDDQPTRVVNEEGQWLVAARDGYPASVGAIREVLLALADARIIEEKTSNPELYGQLGVQGPGVDGGESIELVLTTPDSDYRLIVGKSAQQSYRYVRIADAVPSFLIDRNPEIPDSPGDWLRQEIVDIDASRVRTISIVHADGDTIRISKESKDLTDFSVDNIPDGRELSYASVANGIAGALADLTLDDVRRHADGNPIATTTYETFDGLRITISAVEDDDTDWIGFSADSFAIETEDEGDGEEPASEEPDASQEAADINARVAGWQYRLPDFKKNTLMRRWDDLLKSE